MPIKYVKGDLFKTELKCIAHGCNTAGEMGSGVAGTVRELFPLANEDYRRLCNTFQTEADGLGKTHIFEENGKVLFNMFTQGDWSGSYGRNFRWVSYDAVSTCFEDANRHQSCRDGLGIPMIGAGLGGGDWDIIEKIIEKSTPDIEVTVYQL